MKFNQDLAIKLYPILIFILTLIVAYIFLNAGDTSFIGFLTEFSAGMLGILFGFGIEGYIDQTKKTKDKNDLIKDIRDELVEIKSKLVGKVYLLYPYIWESAIASGQIRLLDSKNVRELAKVYRFISGVEYEAKRVRDSSEDCVKFQYNESPLTAKSVQKRHFHLKEIHDKREEQLSKMIDEILQKDWIQIKNENVIVTK